MRELPAAARIYVGAVIAVAGVLVAAAIPRIPHSQWLSVAVLALLVVVSETAALTLRTGTMVGSVGISTTMPVILAAHSGA